MSVTTHFAVSSLIWAAHISNVESKSVSTDGLKDVIELGRLHERDIDQLHMRKVAHELHPETDISNEADVFEKNGHASTDDTATDANGQHDLGIDFVRRLAHGEIKSVL